MAYIKSHTVLLRHRKNIELAHDLRLNPIYTMGHLHALWHEALEQQEDGDLSAWSDAFLASCAGFTGDAPQFVRLLQKNKWLEESRLLHDWLDYAGQFLISKYKTRNKEKLTAIWAKHGRVYGAGSEREVEGKALDGADKTDRQIDRPAPPKGASTARGDKSRCPCGIWGKRREVLNRAGTELVCKACRELEDVKAGVL